MQQETLHFASFSNQTSPERRRHPRLKLAGPQPAIVEIAPGELCAIVDISEGGMSLRSDSYARFPPKGKFKFTLPGSNHAVEVFAQLAWVNRKGTAGMKFLEISPSLPDASKKSQPSAGEQSASAKVISLTRPPAMSLTSLREKVFVLRSQPRVALHLIVKQMMALTRATGAVIAMQNEAGRIICLASAGRAPGIGAVLKPDSGLSGECVRSGEVVCCDDATQDTRVDPKLSEVLGFRSMVISPLLTEGRVAGVLEILSAEPQRFGSDEVAMLAKIAELVLDIYPPPRVTSKSNDTKPAEPQLIPEPKPPEAAPKFELVKPQTEERAVVPAKKPDVPSSAKVEERTVAPPKQLDPLSSVPKPSERQTNAGTGVCDVCGHQNASDARDCEKCDVPLPVAVEMEAKSLKRKPVAFEIPERDDRLERLVSALWRPLLLLIVLTVAFMLVKSYWRELRAFSQVPEQPKPVSSTASSTPISRK